MQKRLNHFMFLFVILAMILANAISVTPAYADDGGTEPVTGESTPPPAAEEPVTTEMATEEPVVVTEVLEQLPEDTQVVVVNDEGNPEPLVTQEAADIVQSGDPYFTVAGVTYYFQPIGGCGALTNCTESATPIQAAINYLSGTGATPDDSTVYIEAGTYAENVTVDGNSWSGGNKPAALNLNGAGSATTTLDGWLSVSNMNVFTVSGLTVIDADTSGNATYLDVVNSAGDVTLEDVSVTNSAGDGAFLQSAEDVIVSDSQFNGNSLSGLVIDSYGSAEITNVETSNNGNAVGLDIIADDGITLTDVTAVSNNVGAYLFTTEGLGMIRVIGGDFSNNDWTGLHAESGSTINLDDVVASDNGTNGAYLLAEHGISVNFSTFNNNVQFNYPEDPGLFAVTNEGSITLNSVTADGNLYGAGVFLGTYGTGAITVSGGEFNENGTFGIQANTESGDITLDGTTASYNGIKGAYLHSSWLGDISISNSTFVENGTFGIFAATADGDITANDVVSTGNNVTVYGANLATATGSVTVSNSTFTLNQDVGLDVVAGDQVTLTNVNADNNGGTDVEVFSISTGEPICAGTPVVSISVQVNGGSFRNSGGYGLMVKPGPQGTLTFGSPNPIFGNNGWGDYLLDLSDATFKDCTPKTEEPEVKQPKVVQVPATGGEPVEQECDEYSGTILELPNGTWVKVGCPFEGFSKLEEVTQENLPGPIGSDMDFLAAIALSLTDGEGEVILNEDGTVTINFVVPENSRSRRHSILFWDMTLNDGKGGWVQLPLYEAGTSFPLNPDNPKDTRTIISGVKQVGNLVTVTVDFSGIFALVAR